MNISLAIIGILFGALVLVMIGLTIKKSTKDKTFTVSLYCKNCYADNYYTFPVGTSVSRAPYLGYDSEVSRVVIPNNGKASEHKDLKCKHCRIGNVA